MVLAVSAVLGGGNSTGDGGAGGQLAVMAVSRQHRYNLAANGLQDRAGFSGGTGGARRPRPGVRWERVGRHRRKTLRRSAAPGSTGGQGGAGGSWRRQRVGARRLLRVGTGGVGGYRWKIGASVADGFNGDGGAGGVGGWG